MSENTKLIEEARDKLIIALALLTEVEGELSDTDRAALFNIMNLAMAVLRRSYMLF